MVMLRVNLWSEISRVPRNWICCTHPRTITDHHNAFLWGLRRAMLKFASQKFGSLRINTATWCWCEPTCLFFYINTLSWPLTPALWPWPLRTFDLAPFDLWPLNHAAWCCTKCRSMVHNVVLYSLGGVQRRSHKPRWTEGRTEGNA